MIYSSDSRSSKRRDLSNYILQICQRFYSDSNNILRDFPKDNIKPLYEAYEDKINSLKVDLRLNNLLTEDVEKDIAEIVSDVRFKKTKNHEKNLCKLRKDLEKKI